jgi:hypothetical protein
VPKQPSPERVADYERLFAALLALMESLIALGHLPPDSLERTRESALRIRQLGFSHAYQGLRQAIGDMLDMTRELPPSEVAQVEVVLQRRGTTSLSALRREFWQIATKVLKRGSIRTEEEYYRLVERLNDVDDPDLQGELREQASRIIGEYETRESRRKSAG